MLFRKRESKVAAPNSLMNTSTKHHTRENHPWVASSQVVDRSWRQAADQQRLTCVSKLTNQTSRTDEEEERGDGLHARMEHVVTVCGCRDGDCADERMESRQPLKQTSRPARELIGQVSDCVQTRSRSRRGFGWTQEPASDVPVVHDGTQDGTHCFCLHWMEVDAQQTQDVVDFGRSGL